MKNSRFILLYLIVSAFLLAVPGCMSDKEDEKKDNKPQEKPMTKEEEEKKFFELLHREGPEIEAALQPGSGKEEEIKSEEVTPVEQSDATKAIEKRLKDIPEKAIPQKQQKAKGRLHFYDDFIILNGDEEIDVNLVFNSAPILDVIPSFADALGFNFLADSDLKSVVTLNINQKMARKDLWNTFDKMLNLAGAGAITDGTLIRIMSLTKVGRQRDSRISQDGSGELLYYPLKNSTAKEAAQQIRPYLGTGAVCTELTRPNALLVSDDRANMPKVKQLLEHIDMAGKISWKRKVTFCRNVLPSKVVEELRAVLPVLGFNVVQAGDRKNSEVPGSINLTGIDRLQVVVISAATDEVIQEIEQWIALLDSSNSLDQERVFVYKIRNSKAVHLAYALSNIYEMQGASLTIDTTTGNNKIENINANNRRTTTQNNNRTSTSAVNNVTNTQTDYKSNIFNSTVKVFADGVLNRLVIRTTPRTYASIKALLNRLDVVPAQVLLQVMIVEVTLTDSTKFGVEFSAQARGNPTYQVGTNYGSDIAKITADESFTSGSGFNSLLNDPENPTSRFGYITALAGNNKLKMIASPQLLVSSHTEAKINVGQEIPYIANSLTNASSATGNVTNTYTSKDVGVILTITPQVASNNLISLKINQVLSETMKNINTTLTTQAQKDNPTINRREVTTSMTIANGKTMIIGGLIQEKLKDDLQSIPGISDVPILNRLTGMTEASMERTELLLLVTGYIISERSKVEDMIRRYNDAIQSVNEFHEKVDNRKLIQHSSLMTNKDFWTDGRF